MNPKHQAATLSKMVSQGKKGSIRVLAVSSGKGGVGKTNVVTNLAYALSRKGKRVLIFDADMGLANIHILLGLAPKYTLEHVLAGEKTVDEIMVDGPAGIKILPAGEGVEELTQLNPEKRQRLLEEFDGVRDDFDFLIFDTGAGISHNVTFFCSIAHEIIIVASTEPTSLTDAYALIKVLFKNHNQTHFRLLVNFVKTENEALQVYQNLSAVVDRFLVYVSLEYLGYIESDPNVPKAVRRQRAFMEVFPYSKFSLCIQNICDKLIVSAMSETPGTENSFLWSDVFPA